MDTWVAPQEKTNRDKIVPVGLFAWMFFAAMLPALNADSGSSTTRRGESAESIFLGLKRALGSAPTPADDAGLLLAGRLALAVGVIGIVAYVVAVHRRRQARQTTAREFAAGRLTAPVYPPAAPEVGRVANLTIEASVLPGGDVVLHGVDRDRARLAQGATPEYWVRVAGRELRTMLRTDDDGLLGLLQANGTRLAERGETTFLQQQGVPFQVRVAS